MTIAEAQRQIANINEICKKAEKCSIRNVKDDEFDFLDDAIGMLHSYSAMLKQMLDSVELPF